MDFLQDSDPLSRGVLYVVWLMYCRMLVDTYRIAYVIRQGLPWDGYRVQMGSPIGSLGIQ